MTEIDLTHGLGVDTTPAGGVGIIGPTTGLLVSCRICRHEFRVPQGLANRRLPCPHCRAVIEIIEPAARVDPLIGRRIGNCRLLYRLGSGGIGLVYAADQLSVGRRIAIKMLGAKAGSNKIVVQRFERESNLCAQISHPYVVHVYDCGYDRGVHYQIMELVEGGTLAGLIEDSGPLPWREAATLMLQLAQALGHIHELGIIHRDVKPANILIGTGPDGSRIAKLADLGLAKQIDPETESGNGLTMEGKPLGSPSFMAPEQIRNARDATARSDIYSLGASFYAALTGRLPFEGKTSYEVMAKSLTSEPVAIHDIVSGCPGPLESMIRSWMSKDPTARPRDAAVVIRDLTAALAAPASGARKDTGSTLAEDHRSMRWLMLGMFIVMIAVVVVLIVAFWR